ncbi:helix-turn-helix domain-containing protein [Proteus vulgaris]
MARISGILTLERTHSGITRARAASKRFGRPPVLDDEQKKAAQSGASISAIAREFSTTRQTILRIMATQQAQIL